MLKSIKDGRFTSQQEIRETVKYVRENPEVGEEIINAKNEVERKLVLLGRSMKPSEPHEYRKKGVSPEEVEKKLFTALISSLNNANMSRTLWLRTDAIKVIKKYSDKKTFTQIIKSVKSLAEGWTETLKELN